MGDSRGLGAGNYAPQPEAEDAVVIINVASMTMVSAERLVQLERPPLESPRQGTSQHGKRPERCAAHAVVISCDLIRVREIGVFANAPDSGLQDVCRAIAGAIREGDDVLRHAGMSSCA